MTTDKCLNTPVSLDIPGKEMSIFSLVFVIAHAADALDIRPSGHNNQVTFVCVSVSVPVGGSHTREEQIQHTQISIRSFSCRLFQTCCEHTPLYTRRNHIRPTQRLVIHEV